MEAGAEDGNAHIVHVTERRAEAVQQKLVRVSVAARAAPEGGVRV